jgi:hypothetical protein
MMSVFSDEWRACLREQYKYVILNNDQVTLRSLLPILERVGFTEGELAQLRVEATMHVDAVPADFVPDLDILKPAEPSVPVDQAFQPHPLECQCPSCVDKNLVPHDADGQPIPADQLDPENPAHQSYLQKEVTLQIEEEALEDDDNPQQLSMF